MNQMNKVQIASAKVTLYQENDCCDTGKEGQTLNVEVVDGGGGPYLVLQTERWALEIDEIQALITKLNEIQRMCE